VSVEHHYDVNAPSLHYSISYICSFDYHKGSLYYPKLSSIHRIELCLFRTIHTLLMSTMDSLPVTNKAAGNPESATNKTLETGAAAVQV
jgi:hypothetical protein